VAKNKSTDGNPAQGVGENEKGVGETLRPLEMAQILRISETELISLTRGGIIPRIVEKRGNKELIVYPWREAVGRFVTHLQSPTQTAREEYLREKQETQKIIREQKELELRKARGDLVEIAHVRRVMTNLLSSLRNHILAIPSRVSRLILGLQTFEEIFQVIKHDIELALREVTHFDMSELDAPHVQQQRNGASARRTKAQTRTASARR
jgi:phage terminase Nu1 subunit (DNA packaging protein)